VIDEIDYFPKRDKYKKKKGSGFDEEWNALKNVKSLQDAKAKSRKGKPEGKTPEKPKKD